MSSAERKDFANWGVEELQQWRTKTTHFHEENIYWSACELLRRKFWLTKTKDTVGQDSTAPWRNSGIFSVLWTANLSYFLQIRCEDQKWTTESQTRPHVFRKENASNSTSIYCALFSISSNFLVKNRLFELKEGAGFATLNLP